MESLGQENQDTHRPLPAAERRKVLYHWNDTHIDYDRESTLHDLISAHARRSPNDVAVIYEDQSLTYAELEHRSNQLAHYLTKLGVEVESLVGLYVQRSLDMIVGILGILKSGGAYVPIDPDFPAARIQLMMEDARTQVLLTQSDLLDNLDPTAYKIVCLDQDWPQIARESSSTPSVFTNSENLAYVVFTSGSTGRPKGAQNVHRSIINLLNSMGRRIGIDAKDNILATTTLSFDPSVWEIFLPLTTGARLTIASRKEMVDGQLLQRNIDHNGITFLRSTPTGWRLYLETGWQGGADLKILCGGEKLTLDLAQKLQQHCAVLWQTYGPAETAVFCTMGIIAPDAEQITIGRPHDNIQIYILNEKQEPVPVGVTGELYIGGDGVGRGYLNRPELSAERFLPNPFHKAASGNPSTMYRTGDLARFRSDGEIIFVGRNDSQVKIHGRRIELGDIETAVFRHPAVKQNITMAREDTPGNLRLVTYFVPEPGHKIPATRELRAFLRRTLPDYMLPVRFVVLAKFPVSPSGKLDRLALPAPDTRGEDLMTNYTPPRSELEEEMAGIFARTLNLESVSIYDGFFELGGNSLLAARLLYDVQKHFGVKIPLRDFLVQPDVVGTCRLITPHRQFDPGHAADAGLLSTHLPPLSPEERQKVLIQWNDTQVVTDRESTLHELISTQAQRTPGSVAVIFEDKSLTYAELDQRSNQLAQHLVKLGVGVESLVGLHLQRSLEMVIGMLAVLKAGGAYVPIEHELPQARIQLMMEDARPKVLLTQEHFLENINSDRHEIVCLDKDWSLISQESTSPPPVKVSAENLAYVMFTSGSNGRPKGVMVSHRAICNHMQWMQSALPLTATDRVLQKTPFSFDASVWEFWAPLIAGAKLFLAPSNAHADSRLLVDTIKENEITILQLVPTLLNLLLAEERERFATCTALRRLFCGGEVLPGHLVRQCHAALNAELFNLYGPTEATIDTTFWHCPRGAVASSVPIGRPIANVQLYVLDSDRQPVPIGATGELYIGGAGLARGYINRPELTAERFVDNPFFNKTADQANSNESRILYKTGDLVRYRSDGNLEYVGRIDQQLKIRGYRVELGELDAAINRHPAVTNSVTIAREDKPGDLRLVTYLLAENGCKRPDSGELRRFLRRTLPQYMLPARFVVVDKFPVLPSGKLDRRALPLPDRSGEERSTAYAAPRNELETKVAGLFAEVLNLERVGIHDSFFDLGGNSLLAARLLYRAQDHFKLMAPMRQFLAQPTIADFAQLIAGARQRAMTAESSESSAADLPDGETVLTRDGQGMDLLQQSNLTRGQFLMWMGQQMNPDAPLYNVVHCFSIHGRLDSGAFQRAFQALVDHNDALRTVFHEVNGVPQQKVLEKVAADVELIDYTQEASPDAVFQAFLEERQMRLLPLDKPLFDAALLKMADDRFIWYFSQHHILTDAVSSELIFERLGHYYQLALDDRLGDISQPAQYADYVRYERDIRQTAVYREAAAYWHEKAAALLPPTEFYGNSPSDSSTHTTRVIQDLGAERSAKLRAIAQLDSFASPSEDMSLFTIFATLLFTTLHRLNGQHTRRIGTPFHGRPTSESMDIIGLFIEMGVMQVEIEEGETFVSLGEKVMTEILDGLAQVQPGISTAEINRAYDVILNYIQATFHEFAGLPVSKVPVHSRHIDAGHNLRLQITDYDASGSFFLLFDMKTALFGESERDWLVAHFLRVVDAFIANHRRPLSDFMLLDDTQRQQLLVNFNDTDAPYPASKTVIQLFEEQAAQTPNAAAAVEGARSATYSELNQRANQLAHYLQRQGVGPETAVAICMERSIEVLVAIWGVLKAGGAYIPIDSTYPLERIAYMLADANVDTALVTDSQILSGLDEAAGMTVVDLSTVNLSHFSKDNPPATAQPENLVYMIYTSGSTGKPKGTMLTHRGLLNYAWWARGVYQNGDILDFPLYSSLAFDLTVTSLFVPLLSGGKVVVYRESKEAPGMEILSVIADDAVDIVKLTPAHLRLLQEMDLASSRIRRLIVGGEDFKTELARSIHDRYDGKVEIFNEYGPTEAVVGCMIHRYDAARDTGTSVPIGRPAANARIYLLDKYDQPVPPGIMGEMVISSDGVARGYHQRPQLTAERFGDDPFRPGARIYRSGDVARWNGHGQMVFLGRLDHQVKIGSARIELGEIENVIGAHESIHDIVVSMVQFDRHLEEDEIFHCTTCGLPSSYPDVTFDEAGVCSLCTDFDAFRDDIFQYFKTMDDLQEIVDRAKRESEGQYDCMMLYSGGKDSTYVLSQLVEMDLRVLAFSLDNGYISEEALDNVRRITNHLGVDLVIGTTPHMNAIFADSLERFSNVCQGCYKAIYTLSMNLARKKGIKVIFTGLSRGQLFETRLDELFRNRIFGVQEMDQAVLAARQVYHSVDDAVHQLLDVSIFNDSRVFGEIQFVDYFRYTEIELDELYDFLSTRVPWIRPRDTGRSTNCLINEAGIYVHQTERGYHNYALPYSWDVRLGHKTREEALEELDDDMRLPMVRQMLDEVGYTVKEWRAEQSDRRLAAYFVAADDRLTIAELRDYLSKRLPLYMMPSYFVRLEQLPLTPSGKVNRRVLPNPTEKRPEIDVAFVAPQSQLEIDLADIWSRTLNVKRVGIHDNFFDLGGASIPAVQVVARISDQYGIPFQVRSFFEYPTVAEQSAIVEELLVAHLESMSDEEVERLLAEMGE